MPKYLTQFTYSTDAVKAMVKSPHDRRAAAEKIFSAAGGRMECMYYCFGDCDGIVIVDFPSEVAAASAVLAVGSSGAFSAIKSTQLISTDQGVEAMQGAQKIVGEYRAPTG